MVQWVYFRIKCKTKKKLFRQIELQTFDIDLGEFAYKKLNIDHCDLYGFIICIPAATRPSTQSTFHIAVKSDHAIQQYKTLLK